MLARVRTRNWLLLTGVVVILALALGARIWRPSPRENTPEPDVPAGFVADYPLPAFDFSGIEYGLSVLSKAESVRQQVALRKEDFIALKQDSMIDVMMASWSTGEHQYLFAGHLTASIGAKPLPFAFGGRLRLQESHQAWGHQTTYRSRQDRLSQAAEQYQRLRRDTSTYEIPADAGYLRTVVRVQANRPCEIRDFGVNVRVNGQLWKTLSARKDAGFSAPLRLSGFAGRQEEVVLSFTKINTEEMVEKLLHKDRPVFLTLEVPGMTVELADPGEDPGLYQRMLPGIRSTHALVELSEGGRTHTWLVNATGAGGKRGVSLTEFLGRVPNRQNVEWRQGPRGHYLANFAGKTGLAVLPPAVRQEGMWLVSLRGAEVTADPKDVPVEPGDYLRLHHLTGQEYWGDAAAWRGYVAAFKRLRHQLYPQEDRFWKELRGYGSDDRPWDVVAKESTRKQALALCRQYEQSFLAPGLPPSIRAYYWRAPGQIAGFREFFAGDDLRLPRYTVTVKGARVWWNTDEQLTPYFVLACGGKMITGQEFERDPNGNSGTIKVKDGPVAFAWSPFDPVEFRVGHTPAAAKRLGSLGKTLDRVFKKVTYVGFQSLGGVLGEQALDNLAGADPQLSKVRLVCEIKHDGRVVPDFTFQEHLSNLLPRVVPEVPYQLFPQRIAETFLWRQYEPRAYYHSATLFEELYRAERQEKGQHELGYLGRALVAYFRALDFQACAELAREIPPDNRITEGLRKSGHFPPGETVSSLRSLGEVARCANKLRLDAPAYRHLVGAVLDWESCLLLQEVVEDEKKKDMFSADELRAWCASLMEKGRHHRDEGRKLDDGLIGRYADDLVQRTDAVLKEIRARLPLGP